MKLEIAFASFFTLTLCLSSFHAASIVPLPCLRDQAKEMQGWLDYRIQTILPQLMTEFQVDMWLLVMEEYAEDTAFWSLKSPTQFSARRRTAYVHSLVNGTVQQNIFIDITEGLWPQIIQVIEKINPKTICLNVDENFAFSDGLHAGQRDLIFKRLANYTDRFVYQPQLALYYIALRPPSMVARYQSIMQTAHAIISEGFSSSVVVPGQTTTEDVVWWFRERIQSVGMTTWFQPSVEILARLGTKPNSIYIEHGDLLWCDFGVTAMGLNTDTQHMAYVLNLDEEDAPVALKLGLTATNRMQDLQIQELVPGRTGNEILNATLVEMAKENIIGTVYSHPIGDWGHAAGPLIGLWDMQGGVPVRGDVKVRTNMWFSIELQATLPVNGVNVSFRQEEDIFVDDQGIRHWVYQRQSQFYLIEDRSANSSKSVPVMWIVLSVLGAVFLVLLVVSIIFILRKGTHPAKEQKPLISRNDDE